MRAGSPRRGGLAQAWGRRLSATATQAHHRGHQHDGADQRLTRLHQAHPDRQEQQLPHDGGGAHGRVSGEQATGQEGQPGREDGDQHDRAEHARGVVAAALHEGHEVEHREDGQGQGLEADDDRGHPRGRANRWDGGAVGAHDGRA